MTVLKYFEAVREALREELERDDSVFCMGEDIGAPGGIYAQTRGLQDEFGAARVRDTPAGEVGFLGAAVGAAITGMRPVVEISFADFFPVCMDQLVNQAAKARYMSGGQVSVPLTVMSFAGGGLGAGPQHSGSYESWLGSMPGLKVVCPSTPSDAKGLLKGAIRDDNPVVVLLHKGMLGNKEECADDPDRTVPIGEAMVRRSGDDVTIVGWAGSVRTVLGAAERLAGDGISADVIDLRSIQPLDIDTILTSVRKTHRLVIAQETVGFSGIGAEICSQVVTGAFDWLDAPIERVAAPFTPVPFAAEMEKYVMPGVDDIVAAVRKAVA